MSEVFRLLKATKRYWNRRLASIIIQFAILFAFWVVLSGRYEAKYLSFGVLSAGLVTFLTNDLFYPLYYRGDKGGTKTRVVFLQLWRFMAYLPWLIFGIIKANLQVAYLVLHPRMPIEPVMLQFRTRLRGSLAQVIVANSITLTPGTTTVNLEEGRYTIHVLAPPAAKDILQAKLQNKVGAIFMEDEESPPVARWAYSLEELKQ